MNFSKTRLPQVKGGEIWEGHCPLPSGRRHCLSQ